MGFRSFPVVVPRDAPLQGAAGLATEEIGLVGRGRNLIEIRAMPHQNLVVSPF